MATWALAGFALVVVSVVAVGAIVVARHGQAIAAMRRRIAENDRSAKVAARAMRDQLEAANHDLQALRETCAQLADEWETQPQLAAVCARQLRAALHQEATR